MLDVREQKGKTHRWKNGRDVFNWWMEDYQVDGQMNLFEDYKRR